MNRKEEVTPRVSILIPVYNREPYIEACVRSAMRQTLREIEIIVVDNHSSDDTWPILERLAAEDSRIRIFRNEQNLGAVPNWQRCMEEARADIAKLLFSDDTIRADYLEKTLPWLDDDSTGFVFTAVRIGNDAQERDGGQLYYRSYERDGSYPVDEFINGSLVPGDRFPVSPGSALMRLADMKRNLRLSLPGSGITDFAAHGAGPDLLLYLLTAAQYERFAYVRDPLCFFRIHPGSITINDPDRYIPRCHQAARDWFRQEILEPTDADNKTRHARDLDERVSIQGGTETAQELCQQGEFCFQRGDLEGAEAHFLRAIRADDSFTDGYNNMGVLWLHKGDAARALGYLAKGLNINRYNRDLIVNTAEVLKLLGEAKDAGALYEGYLARNPDDSGVRELLSELDTTVVDRVRETETGSNDAGHDAGGADAVPGQTGEPGDAPVSEILVSAIVSTYNSEAYLRGCLEDLLAQTLGQRLEIIVIDSGSEQNERAIVEEFRADHPNIRYLRTERETIYAAWNRGVRMARGRYITNANADDRHRRDALERMAEYLQRHSDIALVYADSKVTRKENASFEDAPVAACFKWPAFDPRNLFAVCYVGPQPMWRKSLHDSYGYFDANLKVAGDYDFWLRVASKETFLHIPELLGLYLSSPGSVEHALASTGARESEQVRERNWPAEWGKRPPAGGSYLVAAEDYGDIADAEGGQVPLVSVVMPTKDRLHLLGRAMDSMLAQRYRNWELLVVNDGGESVRSLIQGRDPEDRIRSVELDQSRGQATARNLALNLARGDIICYLDDDDIYLPDHLQTVVNALADEGSSFIYTDAVVVKESLSGGEAQEVGRSNPYTHSDYSHERLLVNNYIPINTWAHRRSCLDSVGLFDSSLTCYEDWEFLLRLAERYEFRHVEKTTVEVRHRVDQIDNVSRKRLGDTEQAYRQIYARHDKQLTEELRAERQAVLEGLIRNIQAWMSDGNGSPGDDKEDFTKSLLDPDATPDEAKDDYAGWLARHSLTERDVARYSRRMMAEWTIQPSFHLVMTHVPGQEEALADTLDSLTAQLYRGWGLSIVSNASCPDPVFEEMEMLEWCQVEGDLMTGVNAVVEVSGADWLGLLEAGTILQPHLLYQHVEYLHQHPEWRLVYMDEDRIDDDGKRYDPLFKPEFNLELLRSIPYMGRFLLVEREALLSAGRYGKETGAEVYDAVLRVSEQFGEQAVGHIPDVLVHCQDRFQLALDQDRVAANRRASVTAHLKRCGIEGEAKPGTLFGSCFVDYACHDTPPVEIIVPVNGKLEVLELFLNSLFSQTQYPNFRVRLLVRDTVEIPAAMLGRDNVDVIIYPQSGDQWQEVFELVRGSGADYLMLMSPGAIAIQPGWLDRLVAHFQKPDVAVVAPRLISSDKKVVGGGIITGAGSYSVGMGAFGGLALEDSGYMGRAQVAQELSAVSTSCVLVRKSVFTAVEGISALLKLAFYQSVDFCQRGRQTGGKVGWTPHSALMFIGDDQPDLNGIDVDELVVHESEAMCKRSLAVLARDPAYNPNLRLTNDRFSVDAEFAPPWAPHDRALSRIVGFGAGSIGSWKFRVQQPLNVAHREQVANTLVLPFTKGLARLPGNAELERLQPDTLLMHNTMHDLYMDTMESCKKVNKTFMVFGQDDLMFALPPKNPFSKTGYKDAKKRLRRCLGIADRVIVTTEPLAEELRSMADDVRVVPNYLDEAVWGALTSQRGAGEKPRVGWAGAQQHLGDLELLEEVVRETADEVDWVFFGMCPDFLQPYVQEIHNPVTFGKYPEKLATLNLDLAVAPLEYNRFNNSKSNLRILEYGVLGWPVVASDIAPYQDGPVCRVPNKPAAWIKAIRERIHDLDATRREGDVLRDWVRENWMLQQHLHEWLAALDPAGESAQVREGRGRAARL